MAPKDLLTPLLGQREETLKVLASLSEADLGRIHGESGLSVRNILSHLASAEMGSAFFIRMAAKGELIHMDLGSRDNFNQNEIAKGEGWTLDRCLSELADARETLGEVFSELQEDDLDRAIRWPEWPARTIRTSIPYMLEHEDAHVDQIRQVVDLD